MENDLIKKIEEIAKDYSDNGKVESLGEWDSYGVPYQHITFMMEDKEFYISFGEMPEA